MKRDVYQRLLPQNCCSCDRAFDAEGLMKAWGIPVLPYDYRTQWVCQPCWSPKSCFYCGTAITNRDNLCSVSTYPHEFAPHVNAEPGEYFACPKCYEKKDKAAQATFERRFPRPR